MRRVEEADRAPFEEPHQGHSGHESPDVRPPGHASALRAAQAAAQDLTKPDMVELQGIRATMEMRDKVTFETTAKAGLYNTKTEQLTLNENIVVTSSSGYQAFLNEALVDVRASKIASDKPVEVKTATWTINANGMEVSEAGDLVRFDRGVFVTLLLDGTTSGAGGGARKR